MTVTDEMVEKAYRAMTDANDKDFISETGMMAALEAVAPMLRAQGRLAGLEEADELTSWNGSHSAIRDRINAMAEALMRSGYGNEFLNITPMEAVLEVLEAGGVRLDRADALTAKEKQE